MSEPKKIRLKSLTAPTLLPKKVTLKIDKLKSAAIEVETIHSRLEREPASAKDLPLDELHTVLTTAEQAYYNTDNPLLSASSYDRVKEIYDARIKIAPAAATTATTTAARIRAPVAGNLPTVTMPYWMGSMDKIKPHT